MKRNVLLFILMRVPLAVFGQGTPTISNVDIVGISDSILSNDLRDAMQKLVGQPADPYRIATPLIRAATDAKG